MEYFEDSTWSSWVLLTDQCPWNPTGPCWSSRKMPRRGVCFPAESWRGKWMQGGFALRFHHSSLGTPERDVRPTGPFHTWRLELTDSACLHFHPYTLRPICCCHFSKRRCWPFSDRDMGAIVSLSSPSPYPFHMTWVLSFPASTFPVSMTASPS